MDPSQADLNDEPAPDFPWQVVPTPAAGEKRSGYISWPDIVLRNQRWPCIAIRGRRPGRSVAIVAGVHGGEYPGILGALRLGRLLNPERVAGALLIMPVVNLPAFRERTAFVTPHDGRNLNRSFPGRAGGTYSEALAFRLLEEVAAPAEALIDLHSGDIVETLAAHTGTHASDDPALARLSREMAEAFGLPLAVEFPPPDLATSLTANATARGVATILVEVGGNGLASDDDVLTVYQGLVNTLRVLGVLEGLRTMSSTRWLRPGVTITAPADGLWRPAITLGQPVAAGTPLGTLTDLLGNDLATIAAPEAGLPLYFLSALSALEGDVLVCLARES